MKSVLKLALIVAALLGGTLAFGQTDITGPTPSQSYAITPTLDLTRGANWNGSGNVQTVNNSFVFTPVSTNTGTCLFISNNNTTSGHAYLLEIAVTGDTKQTRFLNGTASRWHDINVEFAQGLGETVAASGTNSYYIPTTGAAKVAVSISTATTAAGSPDTADIYVTQGSASCSAATASQQSSILVGGFSAASSNASTSSLRPPLFCDGSVQGTLASGATVAISQTVQTTPYPTLVAVCSYSITGGGGTETASTVNFVTGTGGTCAGPTAVWPLKTVAAQTLNFSLSISNAFLFTGGPSASLCLADGGTTTGVTYGVTYAVIPVLGVGPTIGK